MQNKTETVVALEEIISSSMDALSEVLSEDNRLMFVGRLANYDQSNRTLRVDLHRGHRTPQGVPHRTPVKIQVHPKQGWTSVVVLYGSVAGCAPDYWQIAIEDAVVCSETRRAFRQEVRTSGQVLWGPREEHQADCQLSDISLVGVGFTSPTELPQYARVTLSVPQLVDHGPSYALPCTLVTRRNIAPEGTPPLWHYGGDFEELSQRLESLLYKDIFALQAKSVR